MAETKRFLLQDSTGCSEVGKTLAHHFQISEEPLTRVQQTFYDTFDWRLHKQHLLLVRVAGEYHLHAPGQQQIFHVTIPVRKQPRFWWQFPAGSVQDMLRKSIAGRALMPLVEVDSELQTVRVLDARGQAKWRVQIQHARVANAPSAAGTFCLLDISALDGQTATDGELQALLGKLDAREEANDLFHLALKAIGREPGDYTSKLHIRLAKNMHGRTAAIAILRHLFDMMQRNEPGVLADLDSEFLHDYRVAIRRTRSALSEIRDVFPEDAVKSFKKAFAGLGKASNRLRDLDVYLAQESQYAELLPGALRPGLKPLFRALVAERKAEFKHVVDVLKSTRHADLCGRWAEFLDTARALPTEATANAKRPALRLARELIFQKYQQVLESGEAIRADSPDEALHRLRIECKKLRYLLEFFASLFPAAEMALLIKQLKKLQDNLGEFNDFSVQKQDLLGYLQKQATGAKKARIAAAIGGLIALLHQKQGQARAHFGRTFAEFTSPGNRQRFARLFAPAAATKKTTAPKASGD